MENSNNCSLRIKLAINGYKLDTRLALIIVKCSPQEGFHETFCRLKCDRAYYTRR